MSSSSDGSPRLALKFLAPYLCYSEFAGAPCDPRRLIQLFQTFDAREAFRHLAAFASIISHPDENQELIEKIGTGALVGLKALSDPQQRAVAEFIGRHKNRPVFHEKVIYFLEALSVIHGGDTGLAPADFQLALAALAANDYLDEWRSGDGLADADRALANFAHNSRFNRSEDPLPFFVRGSLMFANPPGQGPLAEASVFVAMQREAFGEPLEGFIEGLAVPLVLISHTWGRVSERGVRGSSLSLRSSASRFDEYVRELGRPFEQVKAELSKAENISSTTGLPYPPSFVRHPFVLFEDEAVAASPWAVREQMRFGVWARCNLASKKLLGDQEAWSRAYGLLFEAWCRRIAEVASQSPNANVAKTILPTRSGAADEIEDVILVDERSAVLFSVKARLLPENDVRNLGSRQRVLAWFESSFFAERIGNRRAGAFFQLDAKISDIRRGAIADVPKGVRIYPVIVAPDDIGDALPLHDWVERKSKTCGVLQQDGVERPTFASIDMFERLMTIHANGGSVTSLLYARANLDAGMARLDVVVADRAKEYQVPRLPFLDNEFTNLTKRSIERLAAMGIMQNE